MIRRAFFALALVSSFALLACNKGSDGSSATTSSSASASAPASKMNHVMVTVTDDGFSPSEVTVKKGEPTMLMFKRTAEKTCATAVEFPELKIKKDLPLNETVSIDVPTGESRTLTFQCGMGMYKSKLVIQ